MSKMDVSLTPPY